MLPQVKGRSFQHLQLHGKGSTAWKRCICDTCKQKCSKLRENKHQRGEGDFFTYTEIASGEI